MDDKKPTAPSYWERRLPRLKPMEPHTAAGPAMMSGSEELARSIEDRVIGYEMYRVLHDALQAYGRVKPLHARVFLMRVEGMTYKQIASAVGRSKEYIRQICDAVKRELRLALRREFPDTDIHSTAGRRWLGRRVVERPPLKHSSADYAYGEHTAVCGRVFYGRRNRCIAAGAAAVNCEGCLRGLTLQEVEALRPLQYTWPYRPRYIVWDIPGAVYVHTPRSSTVAVGRYAYNLHKAVGCRALAAALVPPPVRAALARRGGLSAALDVTRPGRPSVRLDDREVVRFEVSPAGEWAPRVGPWLAGQ